MAKVLQECKQVTRGHKSIVKVERGLFRAGQSDMRYHAREANREITEHPAEGYQRYKSGRLGPSLTTPLSYIEKANEAQCPVHSI
jgi:hypothetical protein